MGRDDGEWTDAPSGSMLVSFTPREKMNSRALLTFSAFWTRIRGFLLYRPRETSPKCAISSVRYGSLSHRTHDLLFFVQQAASSKAFATHHELYQSDSVRQVIYKGPHRRVPIGFQLRVQPADANQMQCSLWGMTGRDHLQKVRSCMSRDLLSRSIDIDTMLIRDGGVKYKVNARATALSL